MNNEIPMLWLWISGIFFFFGIVAFGATIAVLVKLLKMAEEMKPKVDSLTIKVDRLVTKLDKVADRVDETMISVKQSVDGVGGKATSIVSSVESFTSRASSKFEGIAPIITGVMAAYKVFLAVKAARGQAKAKSSAKALPGKK
jgi:uncharacterized protein YoxC